MKNQDKKNPHPARISLSILNNLAAGISTTDHVYYPNYGMRWYPEATLKQ